MSLSISFVIPAYNEQQFIAQSLGAIRECCEAEGLIVEVIVVDNGSVDGTSEIANQAGARVITTARTTVSRARNLGAAETSSELVAFLDADVLVTARWAGAARRLLASDYPPRLLTGFQVVTRPEGSWIEEAWFKHLRDNHVNAGNLLMTRAAFAAVNGFDESLKTGEDYDICKRAVQAGVTYAPDREFEAIHLGFPRSLRGFVRREIWHGEGDFKSLRHFLASPVAILGVGYIALQLFAVLALVMRQYWLAALILAAIVLGNVLVTLRRFGTAPVGQFILRNVAHYFYFTARGLSLARAIANRRSSH